LKISDSMQALLQKNTELTTEIHQAVRSGKPV
jgi:hypothetical protein